MYSLALWGSPLVALLTAFWWLRTQRDTFVSRFSANHAVSIPVGALSLALCWTWVFLFMVGPARAYTGGLGPFSWFAWFNIAGLGLVAFLSIQALRIAGPDVCTLPGLIKQEYDSPTTSVYAFAILGIQGGYAVIAQFIGAYLLLNTITGVQKETLVLLVGGTMFLLAVWRGLPSSIIGDMTKAASVAVVVSLVGYIAVHMDIEVFEKGLRGVKGNGPSFFNPALVAEVGIPTLITLCTGAPVDAQLWQRIFALSSKASKWSPWLAVPIFAVIVFVVGVPSFLAAGVGLAIDNPQLAAFAVITDSFETAGGVAFTCLIAMLLVVTGASALNAATSAIAVDVGEILFPETYRNYARTVSCILMGILVVIGGWVSLKTKITLDDMFLFVGPFRAGLVLPLVLGLYTAKRKATSFLFPFGVLTTMAGSTTVAFLSSPLHGGLVALGASCVLCVGEWGYGRTLRSRAL